MEQKILIVDDEAHIRMLIEQTLEELEDDGVKFLIAENGEEAFDRPAKHSLHKFLRELLPDYIRRHGRRYPGDIRHGIWFQLQTQNGTSKVHSK